MLKLFFNKWIVMLLVIAPVMHIYSVNSYVENGNFATGDFTGWTTEQQNPNGYWSVSSGGITPLSNHPFYPPPQQAYAAIADDSNPSGMVLYQNITLPTNETLTLLFTYYYNNFAFNFFNPGTLYLGPFPNQQFRIDIMNPAAIDPYSVEPTDIWENLLLTVEGDPYEVSPTTVSYDLTPYAGQTIRLRFAMTVSEFFFLVGITSVSIY